MDISKIINQRRIVAGPEDRIRSASLVKYDWTIDMWNRMLANEWRPQNIGVSEDNLSALPEGAQLGFKRALAFVTNLDGLQVENLSVNVVDHITEYGVKQCIYRQIYEEALHVESYGLMIDSLFVDNPAEIFYMHETNTTLREKNDFILAQANAIQSIERNAHTDDAAYIEQIYYAIISNIILEGIYFNSAFLVFYLFPKHYKAMERCAENVEYIHRDENTHTLLFLHIARTMVQENPHILDNDRVRKNVVDIFLTGGSLEKKWGHHIIEGGIAGATTQKTDGHINFLTDFYISRLSKHTPIFKQTVSPYSWFSDLMQDANSKSKNFFESRPDAYSQSGLDW